MSTLRCQLCGSIMYGRSDKLYCSSTCRRDACRIRKRTMRWGGRTFVGSELAQSDSVENFLIPKLERLHGRHHRSIHQAQRQAEELREAEMERLRRAMEAVELFRSRDAVHEKRG
jgi:hypothetical protein